MGVGVRECGSVVVWEPEPESEWQSGCEWEWERECGSRNQSVSRSV